MVHGERQSIAIAGMLLLAVAATLLASATVARGTDLLPAERAALVVFKSLPYNQTWSDRESLVVRVIAFGPAGVPRAEEIGSLLEDISRQAASNGVGGPRVQARAGTWTDLESEGLPDPTPDVLFLVSAGAAPPDSALRTVTDLGVRHSILVATDDAGILESVASIGFLLSPANKPEIWVDLERARLQGARFQAGFLRLARLRGGVEP